MNCGPEVGAEAEAEAESESEPEILEGCLKGLRALLVEDNRVEAVGIEPRKIH